MVSRETDSLGFNGGVLRSLLFVKGTFAGIKNITGMRALGTITTVVVLSLVCALCSAGQPVHRLTEDSFEHDTQAATGATTGNWFVMFKSDNCRFCLESLPIFEAVAAQQSMDDAPTNFAVVDCDESSWVCNRFDVRSYPSFVLLSRGKQYKYVAARTVDAFKSFIAGGYQAEAGTPVPSELTSTQKALSYITFNLDDLELIREHMPWLYYAVIGATALLVIMILLLIGMLISQRADAKKANGQQKRQQSKVAAASKKKS